MDKLNNQNLNDIQGYLNSEDTSIDESLVSLKFMKEIYNFMELNDINQKEIAHNIGYTESYISQLLSGVKKINISFMNKLENEYNVDFQINIVPRANCIYRTAPSKINQVNLFSLNVYQFNTNSDNDIGVWKKSRNDDYVKLTEHGRIVIEEFKL